MEANKSKVKRVTENEENIIKYVRNNNENLINELQDFFNNLSDLDKEKYLYIRGLMKRLKGQDVPSLDELDYITKDQALRLIKDVEENKNIIIIGEIGSGKTTLLRALLQYQTDVRMMVVEDYQELVLEENNNIEVLSKSTRELTFTDISEFLDTLKNNVSRLILGEFRRKEDKMLILSVLNMGSSIAATMCTPKIETREELLKLFNTNSNKITKALLENKKFTIITLDVFKDEKGKEKREIQINEI